MDQGVRFLNVSNNQKTFSTARLIAAPMPVQSVAPVPIVPTRTNLIMVDGRLQKIPRPQNAFMLFANDNRKQYLERYSGECNARISTKLGEAWAALSKADKDVYYRRAQIADIEHKQKYPFYHYTPTMSKVQKRKYQTTNMLIEEQRKHTMSDAIKRQRETLQSLVQTINGPTFHFPSVMDRGDTCPDRDDMQVLTPMRAQQMVNQVQSCILPSEVLSPRPRRGRPPKIKPTVPTASEPVPAAPKRGRPRKRPLTPSGENKPVKHRKTQNCTSTKSTSASTSKTQFVSQNAQRVVFPESALIKTQDGKKLDMKLIPISGTGQVTPTSIKSGVAIQNIINIEPCDPDTLDTDLSPRGTKTDDVNERNEFYSRHPTGAVSSYSDVTNGTRAASRSSSFTSNQLSSNFTHLDNQGALLAPPPNPMTQYPEMTQPSWNCMAGRGEPNGQYHSTYMTNATSHYETSKMPNLSPLYLYNQPPYCADDYNHEPSYQYADAYHSGGDAVGSSYHHYLMKNESDRSFQPIGEYSVGDTQESTGEHISHALRTLTCL